MKGIGVGHPLFHPSLRPRQCLSRRVVNCGCDYCGPFSSSHAEKGDNHWRSHDGGQGTAPPTIRAEISRGICEKPSRTFFKGRAVRWLSTESIYVLVLQAFRPISYKSELLKSLKDVHQSSPSDYNIRTYSEFLVWMRRLLFIFCFYRLLKPNAWVLRYLNLLTFLGKI